MVSFFFFTFFKYVI